MAEAGKISLTKRHKKTLSVDSPETKHDNEHQSSKENALVLSQSPEMKLYQSVSNNEIAKVFSILQNSNVNMNWRNPEDHYKTALHVATASSNAVIVALLLGKGAEVWIRDSSSKSPLNLALELQDKEIINLLANQTLSSLEAIKSHEAEAPKIKKAPAEDHRSLSRNHQPQHSERVDSHAISTQLDKIFQMQTPTFYKSHFTRESALNEMLKLSHFQTIYNIFVAVFFIAFANTLLHNYFDRGVILDFSLLFWCFGDFPNALMVWLVIFSLSFIPLFLQKGIVAKIIPPKLAYSLYALLLIGLYSALPFWVRHRNYPPSTAFAILCEMVRLSMKMHSYLMVNKSLRTDKEKSLKDPTKEVDPSVKEYPNNVNFWNYFEYLWFPTLVYQTQYPRTDSIRIGFVLKSLSETFLCTLYIYAIFERYCLPHYQEMNKDLTTLLMAIFRVMLPGIALNLLAFFGLLHSWLNGFAELTRFGDRRFYSDWWNSTSWGIYYRKWNAVVHNFLHRHIYLDAVVTYKLPKSAAMWLTFIISAIVHEYIIGVGLGFYKPILLLMFLVPGVLFIYLTEILGRGSRGWNVFMWAMLIVGHGMLVGLYMRAWHETYYTNKEKTWFDYLWIL